MTASTSPLEQATRNLGRIPFLLRVGVTGHRRLAENHEQEEETAAKVTDAVRGLMDRVRGWLRLSPETPLDVRVVSSLAEGADRVVAEAILRDPDHPGADLEVVLPFPWRTYLQDFKTERSRQEFVTLLESATRRDEVALVEPKAVAYDRAGQLMLDRSDIVIAVWDGMDARGVGGTAMIARRAERAGLPVFRIAPLSAPDWTPIMGRDIPASEYHGLKTYNRHSISTRRFRKSINRELARLSAARTPDGVVRDVAALTLWNLPYFVRADLLARRYEWLRTVTEDARFLLAGTAVIAVAAQVTVLPRLPLARVEVACMVGLLPLLLAAKVGRWHDKWLTYRSLAERLRAALFVRLAGGRVASRATNPLDIYDPDPSQQWLDRAVDEVAGRGGDEEVPMWLASEASRFLSAAWVRPQLGYCERAARRYRTWRWALSRVSYGLFALTLILAVLHAAHKGEIKGQGNAADRAGSTEVRESAVGKNIEFWTIALPAIGVAVAGVGAGRESLRNAERLGAMTRHLLRAKSELDRASDSRAIIRVAEDLQGVATNESLDWFRTMRFHETELPT